MSTDEKRHTTTRTALDREPPQFPENPGFPWQIVKRTNVYGEVLTICDIDGNDMCQEPMLGAVPTGLYWEAGDLIKAAVNMFGATAASEHGSTWADNGKTNCLRNHCSFEERGVINAALQWYKNRDSMNQTCLEILDNRIKSLLEKKPYGDRA